MTASRPGPVLIWLLPAIVVVALVAPPAAAPESTRLASAAGMNDPSFGRGFALYHRYCRSCHGKKAEGDGHVAEYLKVQPVNLTRLALENDGEFPAERVLRSIDGREEMAPLHGRDMPIWGKVFEADEGQTEEDVQAKLADLIAYLEGIQVEDAP